MEKLKEEEARQLNYCPACQKEKSKGLVVCWKCYKHRENSLKWFKGSFQEWLKTIKKGRIKNLK